MLVMSLILLFYHIYQNDQAVLIIQYQLSVMEDHWQIQDYVERLWGEGKTKEIRVTRTKMSLPKIGQVFTTFGYFWFFIWFFEFSISSHLLNSKKNYLKKANVSINLYSSSVNGLNCAGFSLNGCTKKDNFISIKTFLLLFDRQDTNHSRLFEYDANKIDKSKSFKFISSMELIFAYLITTCAWKKSQIIGFKYFQT